MTVDCSNIWCDGGDIATHLPGTCRFREMNPCDCRAPPLLGDSLLNRRFSPCPSPFHLSQSYNLNRTFLRIVIDFP